MQFGDDPEAVEEAQAVVPDNGLGRCLVEELQKLGLHAERLESLEEIQTLIPFLYKHCRALGRLSVQSSLPFDLKRDG